MWYSFFLGFTRSQLEEVSWRISGFALMRSHNVSNKWARRHLTIMNEDKKCVLSSTWRFYCNAKIDMVTYIVHISLSTKNGNWLFKSLRWILCTPIANIFGQNPVRKMQTIIFDLLFLNSIYLNFKVEKLSLCLWRRPQMNLFIHNLFDVLLFLWEAIEPKFSITCYHTLTQSNSGAT